jgi:hypothetical protein
MYPQIIQEAPELLKAIDSKDRDFQIIQKPSEQSAAHIISPSPEKLVKHFSFSHFVELMRLADPLKRAFYEIEGFKGCWSVPQLKRQIESLLYERTGKSKDKAGIVDAAHAQNIPATIDDMIRDPYVLEFAGRINSLHGQK